MTKDIIKEAKSERTRPNVKKPPSEAMEISRQIFEAGKNYHKDGDGLDVIGGARLIQFAIKKALKEREREIMAKIDDYVDWDRLGEDLANKTKEEDEG